MGKKDLLFVLMIALVGVGYFYLKNRIPDLKSTEIRFSEQGSFKTVSDLEEDNVIVLFFASWCGHCIQEIPSLNQSKQKFVDRNIRLLMVTDDEKERIDQAIVKYNIQYEILPLDGSIKSFGVNSIPATFFYKNGELVHSFNGVTNWNSKEADTVLDQYFK